MAAKPLRDLGDPRDDPDMIDARSILVESTARKLDEKKARLVELAEMIHGGPLGMELRPFLADIGVTEWDIPEDRRLDDPMKATKSAQLDAYIEALEYLAGMANKIHQTYPG